MNPTVWVLPCCKNLEAPASLGHATVEVLLTQGGWCVSLPRKGASPHHTPSEATSTVRKKHPACLALALEGPCFKKIRSRPVN